ncbi:hypothetical protein T265_00231 [Opisthorchis viverrini]|uniref:Uncharacterized protein n=1 Tax=Opisthorchis viverrini TaxID=6198 RepID=A0A075A2V6_OPIVI|nr:hypothetical protein T265_00231 [Opisthorchis viverrini]KER34048.1 hypothetical protein T265_00231 [Opisthorchis viverrini]
MTIDVFGASPESGGNTGSAILKSIIFYFILDGQITDLKEAEEQRFQVSGQTRQVEQRPSDRQQVNTPELPMFRRTDN